MKTTKQIEEKINQLPPEFIGELERFLDGLIDKSKIHQPRRLTQNWAGGLKDIKESSIELQKKALDWRQK
jgi:hypothetical protein